MPHEDTLLGLVASAYRAAVEPEFWPRFLRQYADAVGATGAALHWINKATTEHVYGALVGIPVEAMQEYAEYYWLRDPRMRWALSHSAHSVFVDYDITTEAEMDRTEFYADFLRRYGLRYFIGSIALNEPDQHCGFAVQRSSRQGHFGAEDVRLARHLTPHIRRAIQLQDRFSAIRTYERSLAAALDHLAMGVIFVDSMSRPLVMNRAAERILCEADGLRSARNGLVAARPSETRRLRRAVFQAAETGDGRGLAAGIAMTLPRPSAKRPLEVLVSPLPRSHDRLCSVEAAAIIFVGDPEHQPRTTRGILAELHGLTPAQAELAEALIAGKTLSEFADETGRRTQTVRKTLRRVFDKTNTARQTELVRYLLKGPVSLEAPSAADGR